MGYTRKVIAMTRCKDLLRASALGVRTAKPDRHFRTHGSLRVNGQPLLDSVAASCWLRVARAMALANACNELDVLLLGKYEWQRN